MLPFKKYTYMKQIKFSGSISKYSVTEDMNKINTVFTKLNHFREFLCQKLFGIARKKIRSLP